MFSLLTHEVCLYRYKYSMSKNILSSDSQTWTFLSQSKPEDLPISYKVVRSIDYHKR